MMSLVISDSTTEISYNNSAIVGRSDYYGCSSASSAFGVLGDTSKCLQPPHVHDAC